MKTTSRKRGLLLAASTLLCVQSVCVPVSAETDVVPTRGGDGIVMARSLSYDYVPSVMFDNGKYRMWWCGGLAGDFIYYSESTSLSSGWTTSPYPLPQFAPKGNSTDFDGRHTCDPSVIKVGGLYLMYYGGYQVPGKTAGIYTKIGVAQSLDGYSWQRLNGDAPIVSPSLNNPPGPGVFSYGVGQPSVVFVDGWFYRTYHDSTGAQIGAQYVLRSSDATFQTNVYELRQAGWTLITGTPQNSHSPILNAVSVDWTYLDAVDSFVVGINGKPGPTPNAKNSLRFYNKALNGFTGDQINIQGQYSEGPGIVRKSNGHAFSTANCSHHLFDIVRSDCNPFTSGCNYCLAGESPATCEARTADNVAKWDLSWLGWDGPTGLTSCPLAPTNEFSDFSGDGRAELAVFRPSNARWYIQDRSDNSVKSYNWGASGDIPVRGDFDRDGVSDPTVWRPSSGTFYFIASAGSCPTGTTPHFLGCLFQWGLNGDVPVPMDYDGNRATDFAVWRPSTGTWYIAYNFSPLPPTSFVWGISTDKPTPGDYDGNGVSEIVVWRPSDGKWYFRASGTAVQFGLSGDIPVPADYNGDGKTDKAVWRPNEANWYVSATGFSLPIQWGLPGDIPVPRNFDGDADDDIGVWRPSEGKWYVRNQGTYQWGLPGDVPLK
jgi:hypothetical protein